MFPIGDRLRELREEKKLSQGHIEKRTGLLRCYISRVENGHTMPTLETLERLAKALDIPLYEVFHSKKNGPPKPYEPVRKSLETLAKEPGETGEEARFLLKLKNLLRRTSDKDRLIFLDVARKLASH